MSTHADDELLVVAFPPGIDPHTLVGVTLADGAGDGELRVGALAPAATASLVGLFGDGALRADRPFVGGFQVVGACGAGASGKKAKGRREKSEKKAEKKPRRSVPGYGFVDWATTGIARGGAFRVPHYDK